MEVQVSLHGCDDSTVFDIEVNELEFQFLEKLSKMSEEYSSYRCMPIMEIKTK